MKTSTISHIAFTFTSTFIVLATLVVSCGQKSEVDEEKDYNIPENDTIATVVKTMVVEPGDFNMEVISNGTITSGEILPLSFEKSGIISKVFVQEGTNVRKGDILAELDKIEIQRQIERKKLDCEESEISLKDILIGQGYSYEKKGDIPENVMKFALIKSGYLRNQEDLEDLKRNEEKYTLRAPFDGVIANLKGKKGAMSNSSTFCELIGTSSIEVEFPILQSELQAVGIGSPILIKGFNNDSDPIEGRIISINPVVDDKGQITVKGSVSSNKDLITGMSVRVFISKSIPDQLVVPKTAVEERSGRKVIFSVSDGKAFWHYVNIGMKNSSEYTITDGIEPGSEIIVAGARNLTEGSYVKIQK